MNKNKYIAFNIIWDADCNDIDLPFEVDVSDYIYDNKYDYLDIISLADIVSDYLSDTYGYCHFGFELKKQ